MDILLLGGTGAMGIPLIELLSQKKGYNVYVTSRSQRKNHANVTYIHGNAKKTDFISSVINRHYDVIMDFMVYDTKEFKERLPLYLNNTDQYFFFSSSRCYAESKGRIKEDSPRLVDICDDCEYLAIDEYGMSKGREENMLWESGKNNWTIIRPYITYNTYRLQLGVYEKEDWLKRALEDKTIVLPKDIAKRETSLTFGPDVAGALVDLIGNKKAYGQAFHITTEETHTWEEILEFYCNMLEKYTGKRPKVKFVENSFGLQKVWNKWQIKYDRLYDRSFDNSKIESVRGQYTFKPTFEGLEECISQFLKAPKWRETKLYYEAWSDRVAGEKGPISRYNNVKDKFRYIKWRYFKRFK